MLDAIFYAVQFYARCARWAAHGTIEKANAWFWLIGIPIVAFIGWWWGLGVLKFPAIWSEFFPFMVATVVASWAGFFVIRFVGAAPHFHRKLRDEIKLRNEREAKKFEFVFDENDPRFVRTENQKTCYFIGLHILSRETIDFPNIWALHSEFTERIFAKHYMGARHHASRAVQIYKGGAIDPDHTEIIELLDLPTSKKWLNAPLNDPLRSVQKFTLQARGRNCKPVAQDFEFDPDKTPMIRMLS